MIVFRHFHSYHHQLGVPNPVGALYIDSMDATLQGGLPIIFAAALVQPHPLTFYLYTIVRIAENVFNHSGLDCWWLDILTLKFLPGRAPVYGRGCFIFYF